MRRITINNIVTLLLVVFAVSSIADDVTFVSPDQDPGLPAYVEARRLMLSGRFAEAAEKFESYLAAFSKSHRADDSLYYLGYCREQLGQKQQAFKRYVEVLENYKGANTYQRALRRAIDLARELRRTKGDEYDKFLLTNTLGGAKDYYAIQSAINLAESGDWNGLPLLITGLQTGDQLQQIRIAGLLRTRVRIPDVRDALEKALATSNNDIVRMTATSALFGMTQLESVREALALALERDPNRMVKITSAAALSTHLAEKRVEQAYLKAIGNERDPIVLINVIDNIRAHEISETMKEEIIRRFEQENNPVIKYALMNGIQGRIAIEIAEDSFAFSLIDNPAPLVRLHALNMLAPRMNDPKVKEVVIDTLKSDPNISVKIAAVTVLAGKVAEKDVREAMITVTLQYEEEISLASSAIRVLSTHVEIPEIRGQLVMMLKDEKSQPAMVTAELVAGLTPVAEMPEVQDAMLDLLEKNPDRNVRIFTARRLRRIGGEERLKRLEKLYLSEKDNILAGYYFNLIAQVDPQRAKSLAGQRAQP
jgi:tetratricopeptide (TPR) repeat protein